jgi:hypothetical protein
MGGSDMMRSQHSPARIIPQVGKITEDHGKTSGNKQRAVFHKHETRSNLTNNSCHVRPQTGLRSGDSSSLSGCADVLAGESAADDINSTMPGFTIKGAHVIPDWESVKASVRLSCKQDVSGIGIKLNSTDGAPSKQSPSQDAASCPCK